jgi:hypothetical protein
MHDRPIGGLPKIEASLGFTTPLQTLGARAFTQLMLTSGLPCIAGVFSAIP